MEDLSKILHSKSKITLDNLGAELQKHINWSSEVTWFIHTFIADGILVKVKDCNDGKNYICPLVFFGELIKQSKDGLIDECSYKSAFPCCTELFLKD